MSHEATRPARSFWGWGTEAAHLDAAQQVELATLVAPLVGAGSLAVITPPTIHEIDLRSPRLAAPSSLSAWCSNDPTERAGHTYGKSFRDVVRGLNRSFDHPPDIVAIPPDEAGVVAVLDWCSDAGATVIPYGGGSSVVGGVEAPLDDDRPVVSLDLRRLDRVLEVDVASRAALIQGGAFGPAIEDQLRPLGLTLRHYPQSFEFSTLGGWLATRSGGHYATLHTHIDDFVESIRAVTPTGIWASRRLPGSGAGPSPDRLLLGSEGILGVITEAWMRLQDRPTHKAGAVARFATFEDGLAAARALGRSGLWPSNCRLVDATEALVTSTGDGSAHLLLVGFESADHPVDAALARAVELVRDHHGVVEEGARAPSAAVHPDSRSGDTADRWRSTFLRAPYLRDALVGLGLVNETFETAITWDRAEGFVADVRAATRAALESVGAWPGVVTCRVTHVYPDGCAPYFTVIAAGDPRRRLDQWHEVKATVMARIDDLGGTVTHHHAVGRDHRPGYDRQRPEPFAAALVAAKASVDPHGILNPGVLVDPHVGGSVTPAG
ncbi:MAG TPA: FAD-binding oxidoreductase [Microthrixaceae bacterium]|nr:FAD-binding oxidoreductase [Microthrixaceae bacterium]